MLDIQTQVDLQDKHTFGLPAKAAYYLEVANLETLQQALNYAKAEGLSVWILGGGSNSIFTQDWDGLVLDIKIQGIEKVNEDSDAYYVFAGAGVHWHSFVGYCLAEQWYGLENLALIPGTVGAAPIQNIGAYGVELSDYVHAVHVLERESGDLTTLSSSDCDFAYRESIFKQAAKDRYVIIGVSFRFPKQWQPRVDYGNIRETLDKDAEITPQAIFEAVIQIRQSKLPDPAEIGNAGSFFKNALVPSAQAEALKTKFPEMPQFPTEKKDITKIPSGWLIDQAGLKGFCHENVGVYEKQALVLVNHGAGTAEQLEALIEHVQEEVAAKFEIELEIEPNLI